MREFTTGATRNTDSNKLDFEGFLSPLVLEEFAEYMHSHRMQADGKLRDSDNWQKGIPKPVYVKSGWRHFMNFWSLHRGIEQWSPDDGHRIDIKEACCSLMFNIMGYLHETIKEEQQADSSDISSLPSESTKTNASKIANTPRSRKALQGDAGRSESDARQETGVHT